MRALFVTTALPRGGAERQWAVLLPRLRDRGTGVRLVTLRGRGGFFDELVAGGIDATCVGLSRRTDVGGWRRAFATAVPAPDVVVSQGVDALVVAAAIARRAHAPHVAVEHGGVGLPRRLHRRLLTRLVARTVDSVVAVTATQKPALVALGYRESAIEVIPNGVDAPRPSRARPEVRAELGVGDDETLALYVAGLRVPKRPLDFIDAVAAARRDGVRLRGVVVGDGALRAAVDERARALDGVRVLGHRSDAAELVAAADVACLASDVEALPMAALEAMSAAVPVVATGVGGVPDAVVDGETGILVRPRDVAGLAAALAHLARDPAAARRLGEAGRRRYERLFTADRMADGYADLLREQLRRRRG